MTPSTSPSSETPGSRRSEAVDTSAPRRRPVPLVVVCALVLLQAGLLVGLAGAWAADLLRGASQLPAATVFLVLFALGVAAVLVLAARGLWQGRRWARSPVMTWEVLLVVLAAGWLGSDPAPWAVAVLVSAIVVGVGLLVPAVVAATVERPDVDGDERRLS